MSTDMSPTQNPSDHLPETLRLTVNNLRTFANIFRKEGMHLAADEAEANAAALESLEAHL